MKMYNVYLIQALKSHSLARVFVMRSLRIRAVNGLSIPYRGYIVTDFQVGGVQVPARGVVIVKDDFLGDKKAILGMNVIWDC